MTPRHARKVTPISVVSSVIGSILAMVSAALPSGLNAPPAITTYVRRPAGTTLAKDNAVAPQIRRFGLRAKRLTSTYATATGHISESLTAALPSGQSARRVTSTCVGTAAKAGNTLVSHSAATPPIGKSG